MNNALHPARILFLLSLAFIAGVFLGSFFETPWVVFSLTAAVTLAAYFLYSKNPFFMLFIALVFAVGFLYASSTRQEHRAQSAALDSVVGKSVEFTAVIRSSSMRGETQYLVARPAHFSTIQFRIYAKTVPEFSSDSKIKVRGVLQKGQGKNPFYLSFPDIEFISRTPGVQGYLEAVKKAAQNRLFSLLPSREVNFVSGILYGENNDPVLSQEMILSGTSHLTAISGYNVTVLTANIYRTLQFIGLSRVAIFPVTLLSIFLFTILTGAEASVVRAALMGAILLLAGFIGRLPYLRNIIVLTAALMLIANPLLLVFDLSFQLSFLAFLGIIYGGPIFQRLFLRMLKIREFGRFSFLLVPLSETIAAQIAVLPLLSFSFGRIQLFAPLANAFILPFIPLAMATGFFLLVIGTFLFPLAQFLSPVAKIVLDYHLVLIHVFSSMPQGQILLRVPLAALIALYAFLVLLLYRSFLKHRNRFFIS